MKKSSKFFSLIIFFSYLIFFCFFLLSCSGSLENHNSEYNYKYYWDNHDYTNIYNHVLQNNDESKDSINYLYSGLSLFSLFQQESTEKKYEYLEMAKNQLEIYLKLYGNVIESSAVFEVLSIIYFFENDYNKALDYAEIAISRNSQNISEMETLKICIKILQKIGDQENDKRIFVNDTRIAANDKYLLLYDDLFNMTIDTNLENLELLLTYNLTESQFFILFSFLCNELIHKKDFKNCVLVISKIETNFHNNKRLAYFLYQKSLCYTKLREPIKAYNSAKKAADLDPVYLIINKE